MQKLLIITDMYPHKYNRVAGVFVYHQSVELSKKLQVRVISTTFPYKYEKNTSQEDNIKVTRVYFPVSWPYLINSVLCYKHYALKVIKTVYEEWQPDIIHVHDCRHIPELLVLRRWLNRNHTKQYLTLHNIRTHPERMSGNILAWIYNSALKFSLQGWTQILTVNEKLRQWVLPYTEEHRIAIIGNAIPPIDLLDNKQIKEIRDNLEPNSFKIISAGNLVKEKDFSLLIEVVNSLVNKGNKIQLMIIGEGLEHNHLQTLIISKNMGERILLTGSLDNEVVRNLYPCFDAFVLPSYSETFGIVYIEAMYAGIPVIGVKGQGIDGIIQDNENGLLMNPHDADDLAAKILTLINNKAMTQAMAQKGQKLIKEHYMLSNLITKIEQMYERE
jgi:teichuronic acid biosynthesis glycosyltransferase TuaC